MVCERWKTQLDIYLDGELPSEQMHDFDAHVRNCASCAADALVRVQLKRYVQTAGKRFVPRAEFRQEVYRRIAAKPTRRILGWNWVLAAALALIFATGLAVTYRGRSRSDQDRTVYGELTDLHVATLASLSPVDVLSTDKHTVKPWFEGKIPFTFDLPELHDSEFSLMGGRVTYLGQTPGAHLILRCGNTKFPYSSFRNGPYRATERNALNRSRSSRLTLKAGAMRDFGIAWWGMCRQTTWTILLDY